MAASDKAVAAWQALNGRQQAYLSAIFDADQAADTNRPLRRRRTTGDTGAGQ